VIYTPFLFAMLKFSLRLRWLIRFAKHTPKIREWLVLVEQVAFRRAPRSLSVEWAHDVEEQEGSQEKKK
jgi:hypothetical protein